MKQKQKFTHHLSPLLSLSFFSQVYFHFFVCQSSTSSPLLWMSGLDYFRHHPQGYYQAKFNTNASIHPPGRAGGRGMGHCGQSIAAPLCCSSLLRRCIGSSLQHLHELQYFKASLLQHGLSMGCSFPRGISTCPTRVSPGAKEASLLGAWRPYWPHPSLSPHSALAAGQCFALLAQAFPGALTCLPVPEGLTRALQWGHQQCLVSKTLSGFFIP